MKYNKSIKLFIYILIFSLQASFAQIAYGSAAVAAPAPSAVVAAPVPSAAVAAPAVAAPVAAPSVGAEVTDIYSVWAEDEIFMAQYVYNLGVEGTYSDYQGALTSAKIEPVVESLEAALKTDIDYYVGDGAGTLTRGQVVAMFYCLLNDGDIGDENDGINYFIDAGLIYGRSAGDYQLMDICTVEEMIVLASRVYNHGVYEAGNYSTGFFWEVEGVANSVYLLGSIHLSDDSMYPMSKPIELAFARSANLFVEADISDISPEEEAYMLEKAYIDQSSGETIADYLSEETFDLLVDVCSMLGIPEEVYIRMKPWMVNNMLTIYLMASGDEQTMQDDTASGIDMYFLTKASAQGKNIMQLESLTYQIDMMDSYSPELQELLILELLRTVALPEDMVALPDDADADVDVNADANVDMDAGAGADADSDAYADSDAVADADADAGDGDGDGAEDTAEDISAASQAADLAAVYQYALAAVKSGDEAMLIELFGIDAEIDDPLLMEYNDKLFKERDAAMAEKIAALLEEDDYSGDYFIVVGAGHLVSKTSVVAQLIEMGYTVNRIK